MPGIAQSLFETFSHLPFERLGQRRSPAGRVEGHEWRKSADLKSLRLGEGIDRGQFALAQNSRRFHVLVNQSLDREDKLIVKRWSGTLGQTTNVQSKSIGASTQPPHQLAAENRSHSRRESTIRRQSNAALLCFLRQRQFLPNYGIVSTQIGEMAARFDRRPRQTQIQ